MSPAPADRATRTRPPMPPGPIHGPAAWRGADLAKSDAWIYAQRYGSVEIGARGGIVIPGATPHVPLEP